MREVFRYVKTDKIVKWSFILAAIFLLSEITYIGFFYSSLPPFLPLFNQLPWGEERLGTKIEIFLPFFIVMSFFIFNFFLANQLYEKIPLVARILSITTFLIATLSTLFTIKTLNIIL